MTDLVTTPPASPLPSRDEWAQLVEVADTMGRSGLFKDVKSQEQAIAKVMFGRDLGLGATQALTGIHIIEGKPELSANLQAAMLRSYRSPEGARYDYRAEVSADSATVVVLRVEAGAGEPVEVGRTTFAMADAQRAGLAKGNYNKYPGNMLFARAMTNAVAWFAPEVTYAIRVYSEGELSGELREPSRAPVSASETAPAGPDVRPCRKRLTDACRETGLSGAAAVGAVQAALDGCGITPDDDLDARLRQTPDDLVDAAAAQILAGYVLDAEVVE